MVTKSITAFEKDVVSKVSAACAHSRACSGRRGGAPHRPCSAGRDGQRLTGIGPVQTKPYATKAKPYIAPVVPYIEKAKPYAPKLALAAAVAVTIPMLFMFFFMSAITFPVCVFCLSSVRLRGRQRCGSSRSGDMRRSGASSR